MEISEFRELLKRFPPLEEFPICNNHHQSQNKNTELAAAKEKKPINAALVAIPMGKKFFIWTTFNDEMLVAAANQRNEACYLLELNSRRCIVSARKLELAASASYDVDSAIPDYGSVFLATAQNSVLFIEDVFIYRGHSTVKLPYGTRLGYIYEFMQKKQRALVGQRLVLPTHWPASLIGDFEAVKPPGYPVYQYQIRYLTTHEIIYNASLDKPVTCVTCVTPENTIVSSSSSSSLDKPVKQEETSETLETSETPENTIVSLVSSIPSKNPQQFRPQFRKPAYKSPAVFAVTPDEQYDVYHLHAYRNSQEPRVQIGVAGIPSLHLSALLNRLFRNIRENDNIDYVEESEDEDDFEEAVYTFKDRVLLMECTFDAKTKKWVPGRAVSPRTRLTPIYKL
jgi:hypothetical protein